MTSHPLDPLTADEITAAVARLRAGHAAEPTWRIASVELVEPPKAQVLTFRPGDPIARSARLMCWNQADGAVHSGIVDLDADAVTSWVHHPGVQPNLTVDEWHDADVALRAEPAIIAALRGRGVTDIDSVLVDTWAFPGHLLPEAYPGRRLGWTDFWYREHPNGNPYANPIGGLHAIVDLNTLQLLDIEDTGAVVKPASMGEYVPALVPGLVQRTDLRDLEITQPDGASWTLTDWRLEWQCWSMQLSFNYREGLVINAVGYEEDGEVRSIAHRLSFAEMVVPYRDPSVDHGRRTAYDIGEWGLGFMTTSLELGCDCLGEIGYLDATLCDSHGVPYTIKNAICIHEEDDRVLWKHVDPQAGAEVRRSRRLVVSFHATVANYEYLVYWSFGLDGTIECEIRATGIMVVSHLDAGTSSPYGTLVDKDTYAPFHQHFLVARLDLDIDGQSNTVYRTETEIVPTSPENPDGMGLRLRNTPLRSELEGRQDYDWSTQAAWKVVNPARLNAAGTPVAYKLVPGGVIPPMFEPGSPTVTRAEVITHQLWVTPNAPDERWPCGEFPTQSVVDSGLPVWTAADRAIEDTDVVLWYVFGIHHITRPEDWPIMPSDVVSFQLKPSGFFDRNPSLDVPATGGHCHPGH